jgi:hypothetical protein
MRFVVLIATSLGLAGQALAADYCPRATEAEDVQLCDLTPNDRVGQAFEALELRFDAPFMQAYGDTTPFVCTGADVGPDGWCRNPYEGMAQR